MPLKMVSVPRTCKASLACTGKRNGLTKLCRHAQKLPYAGTCWWESRPRVQRTRATPVEPGAGFCFVESPTTSEHNRYTCLNEKNSLTPIRLQLWNLELSTVQLKVRRGWLFRWCQFYFWVHHAELHSVRALLGSMRCEKTKEDGPTNGVTDFVILNRPWSLLSIFVKIQCCGVYFNFELVGGKNNWSGLL